MLPNYPLQPPAAVRYGVEVTRACARRGGAGALCDAASETFDSAKAEIISILQSELEERADGFLENLKQEVERLKPLSTFDVAQHLSPKGQIITRDTVVLGQGTQVPPHISFIAEVK